MPTAIIVWFRLDFRLEDNPALQAALERGGPIIPLFIWSPDEDSPWPPGAASRWWLHQSLRSLNRDLGRVGSRLLIRKGASVSVLLELARSTGAGEVLWNRRYESALAARDAKVIDALQGAGIKTTSYNSALLHEPGEICNKSGKPFQVFTPFWRASLALPDPPEPLPAPDRLPSPRRWPVGLVLEALELEPKIDWAAGMRSAWKPGAAGARRELDRFLATGLANYAQARNLPAQVGTSRLSPHLHFGEISPRQIWHAVRRCAEANSISASGWRHHQFLAEIGWREFAHHLLHHFPHTPERPLRAEFERFPWRRQEASLKAWQHGETGYPFVDAGLRELWATGWMHNRVRMVAASFLVKHLLLSWRDGAQWFWDTLVDADLANNTLGWQWTAGCGADAAPFFRVFNPVAQGEKFDASGDYVRRWVPELAGLPEKWIHRPFDAPESVLRAAGVALGETYPAPVVNHIIAREVALHAYSTIRQRARSCHPSGCRPGHSG